MHCPVGRYFLVAEGEELHTEIPKARYWLVFLLILPLSLGNFNNGQANPLVTGLLMIAIVSAHRGRWTISALCLGISAYLKIYPLAVGLLLVLLYPRQLGWRLLVTLLLLGALSFVLQEPGYVLEQYRRWFATRAADDRRANMDIAPRDFAMLLQALHINLSSQIRLIFQLLAAIGAAAVCVYGRIRNWSGKSPADCRDRFTLRNMLDAALPDPHYGGCHLCDDRTASGIGSGANLWPKNLRLGSPSILRVVRCVVGGAHSQRVFSTQKDYLFNHVGAASGRPYFLSVRSHLDIQRQVLADTSRRPAEAISFSLRSEG